MKTCSKCNSHKPFEEFHKRSSSRDGLNPRCKTCRSDDNRQYCQNYPEVRKKSSSDYYKKNKKRHLSLIRARQLRVKNATPDWLTEDQANEIQDFYWLSGDLSCVTGEPYEVDHIVPIKGHNVCGLHVPWNLQVLPRDLNRSKRNSW